MEISLSILFSLKELKVDGFFVLQAVMPIQNLNFHLF